MADAAIQAAMTSVLITYGSTVIAHRTYIVTTHGLNSWDAYTTIEFENFAEISK